MPGAILVLRVFAVLAWLTWRGVQGSASVESWPPTWSNCGKLAEGLKTLCPAPCPSLKLLPSERVLLHECAFKSAPLPVVSRLLVLRAFGSPGLREAGYNRRRNARAFASFVAGLSETGRGTCASQIPSLKLLARSRLVKPFDLQRRNEPRPQGIGWFMHSAFDITVRQKLGVTRPSLRIPSSSSVTGSIVTGRACTRASAKQNSTTPVCRLPKSQPVFFGSVVSG